MKRRNFLSAAGTVGLVGTISGSTIISSTYSSVNSQMLLSEFSKATKKTFNKLITNVSANFKSLGLDGKFVDLIVQPTKIVSKKSLKGDQRITYLNGSGEFVSISIKQGKEHIKFSKSL